MATTTKRRCRKARQAAPETNRIPCSRQLAAPAEPESPSRGPLALHLAPLTPEPGFAPEPRPTRQQIRERAYLIYLARAGAPGDAVSDWRRAEKELRRELGLCRCKNQGKCK